MEKIKGWLRKLFTFLTSHKRLVVELAVIALFCIVSINLYASHKMATEETPVIHTVYSAQDTPLAPYAVLDAVKANNRQVSAGDANQLTKIIERTTETKAPTYQYYTTTDSSADKMTQQYAVAGKADTIVKQQDKKTVGDTTVVDNKYYAITNARKHSISVGVADVDNEAYATVAYRNRDITYTGYYSPQSGKTGAGVSVQIARW